MNFFLLFEEQAGKPKTPILNYTLKKWAIMDSLSACSQNRQGTIDSYAKKCF